MTDNWIDVDGGMVFQTGLMSNYMHNYESDLIIKVQYQTGPDMSDDAWLNIDSGMVFQTGLMPSYLHNPERQKEANIFVGITAKKAIKNFAHRL